MLGRIEEGEGKSRKRQKKKKKRGFRETWSATMSKLPTMSKLTLYRHARDGELRLGILDRRFLDHAVHIEQLRLGVAMEPSLA